MHPRPLPPSLRNRAFDVRAADRAGVSRQRLRRSDLVRPTRSIRWARERPPDAVRRIRALRPILLPGQFVSHVSAAVLWGLPVPVAEDAPVHVTSLMPAAQPRRVGVVGHRLTPDRAAVADRWGLPASTPAALWVDCGAVLTVDELVVLGDAIVTEPRCRTTIDDLRRALARAGARAGVRRLRAAVEQVRVGAGSPQETRARLAIVRRGLPEPELQVEIRDAAGCFVGRVDLAYRRERIVIEYEGDQHRTDAEQWGRDLRRYREFERLGWAVVRWSRSDLARHVDGAVGHLRSLLARRG
ncbi:DUF559 domain-containing protein [Curtobacterium sp. MCPF17_002]|uniref:endonuclease domain-containing protein n=1 Tax=Curtobacterium sp. MCPF17_002 TaxID=2175645 RepID=UPI0011B4C356|nr:DUF559 domain-containing protein [Curtobacterium sp. MCPF17_002]WIB78103.1 DUF559 domain-containing protein [Curtobacterium sp. MCPF17_002]